MVESKMAVIVSFTALVAGAVGQCDHEWRLVPKAGGTDLPVLASAMWDPDGPGPLAPLLVAGGEFTVAGSVAANHVATYDHVAEAWSPLGEGCNGAVRTVLGLANGDLVVGGDFTLAGGVPCQHVARWNGAAWSPIGLGVDDTVRALAELPGGVLCAGGDFQSAGGLASSHIARWNGATWSPLGSGTDLPVHALLADQGALLVGGKFTMAGGQPAARAAQWSGGAVAAARLGAQWHARDVCRRAGR